MAFYQSSIIIFQVTRELSMRQGPRRNLAKNQHFVVLRYFVTLAILFHAIGRILTILRCPSSQVVRSFPRLIQPLASRTSCTAEISQRERIWTRAPMTRWFAALALPKLRMLKAQILKLEATTSTPNIHWLLYVGLFACKLCCKNS